MMRRLAALSLLVSLSLGFAPVASQHCPADDQAAAEHHHEAPAGQPSDQTCDHCPPEECATTAPCGGSLSGLASRAIDAAAPAPASSLTFSSWHPAQSRDIRPPTPPPTSLL
jgi:hypothetical protein